MKLKPLIFVITASPIIIPCAIAGLIFKIIEGSFILGYDLSKDLKDWIVK